MKKVLLIFSFLFVGFTSTAQTWEAQATGFVTASRGVSEIKIVNANVVWALAYDGAAPIPPATEPQIIQEFTKTIDGGLTWTPGTINVGNSAYEINNICPVSATTAWVSALTPAEGNGVIYKTSDGGTTWVRQNNTAFQTTGSSFINGVHFFDENVGIAFGDPVGTEFEMYRTINGGTTWTAIPGASIPNPLNGEYGYNGGNMFYGNSAWLPTTKGRILKSTNQGSTWTVSQGPLTDFGAALPAQSGRLSFSDANNGCLLKTSGTEASPVYTFYTTSNGGTTWTAGSTFTGTYRVLTYVPGTTTLVATSAGSASGSAFSNDNGTNWTTIDSGEQRGIAAFFDGSTGWCAGFNLNSSTGGIFKLNGTLGNNNFNSAKFKVYPNPASSVVNLQTEGLDSYTLKVTDLSGKVMTSREFSGIENSLDISSYATGVYFFEINSGSNTETIKIMKN